MEIVDLGAAFQAPSPIGVKYCTAKRTQVPVGHTKFDMNRCNESPLRGVKPDFWPVSRSKFNTGSLPIRGILPVIDLMTEGATRCRNIFDNMCIRVGTIVILHIGQKFHLSMVTMLARDKNRSPPIFYLHVTKVCIWKKISPSNFNCNAMITKTVHNNTKQMQT